MKAKHIFSMAGIIFWSLSIALANAAATPPHKEFNNLKKSDWVNNSSPFPFKTKPADLTKRAWSQAITHISSEQHKIKQINDKGNYKAINLSNNLQIHFNKNSISIMPRTRPLKSSWQVDMALTGFGYEGGIKPLAAAKVVAIDNKIEYQRGSLTEWYINDQRGLEQGFTVKHPPQQKNNGKLIVEISGKSSLKARVKQQNTELSFIDKHGKTLLNYGKLLAWDAKGKILPASLQLKPTKGATDTFQLALVIDDQGAQYPVIIDPLISTQAKKLVSDNVSANDFFGRSVSLFENTLVVGALRDSQVAENSGAVYIFEQDAGGASNWGLTKKLIASDAAADREFGWAVAVDNDTLLVSSSDENTAGSAYIFERNNGGDDNWGQVKKFTSDDGQVGDFFGESVAIFGDTAVIGADGDNHTGNESGSAYIFERHSGGQNNWGQVKKIIANDASADNFFGVSVAIHSDTVIIGASGYSNATNSSVSSGSAYVFQRHSGGTDNWGQEQQVFPESTSDNANFGWSVAIDSETVVVGAPLNDTGIVSDTGAAYIFTRHIGGQNNWGLVKKLTASDGSSQDVFGRSVNIDSDIVIVGAPGEDGAGANAGSAYLFSHHDGGLDNWGQIDKLTANDASDDGFFGWSVAVNEDKVVAGASLGFSDRTEFTSDSTYVFDLEDDNSGNTNQLNAVAGLGIRAVIESIEKGDIEAIWSKGGEALTSGGDRVIWGHFYANPDDVTWGSPDNPELFVKIWFDRNGRIDVNYFHVSVPNIRVLTARSSDSGSPDESGTTTLEKRYIRHYFETNGNSSFEENFEDGLPPAGHQIPSDPNGYIITSSLDIGASIDTVEAGSIEGILINGGQDTTSRGDQVIWGYFTADPDIVTWGNKNNPEVFVKIWFDVSGRIDVNYFHVSVPDIGVYSAYENGTGFDQRGVTILEDRYTRHEFSSVGLSAEEAKRLKRDTKQKPGGNNEATDPNQDTPRLQRKGRSRDGQTTNDGDETSKGRRITRY